ncbi:glycoside hydrolase family 3 N-terminal domain-containing protein [Conexibacter woesei]|uniref:glycoside hydrolase family 3 N-terminal domain-containing protein n=1 Tax=Conexibacter woesei TaxID=191495 RepID=UPI00041EB455|nr:glycoside hydrolase family 3 N-terminal domain-containing protein [Conexibacter woesei]
MTRPTRIGPGGSLTIVMAALLAVLLSGCGTSDKASGRATATVAGPASTAVPASTTAPASSVTTTRPSGGLPTTAARAAARLLLIGFGGPTASPDLLRRVAAQEWGGVVLEPGNGVSPQQVADVAGALRGAATGAGHQAPLIAASQLGGQLDAVPVEGRPQADARSAGAARAAALAEAKALHPLGIRMVLGPDADIGFAGGPWEGVAYADDAATVGADAAAAVSGWKDGEVAPVPGHFPGEGAASGDPALEAATVGLSLPELEARDLKPFAAVAGHAPAIQLSSATYVAWDGVTPATLLPGVVRLLRERLRFGGVVVSGDLQAASLSGGASPAQLAVQAIRAGCDLVWIPGDAADQADAVRAIAKAMRDGKLSTARVADALRRVDALRAQYGVK